MTPDVLKKEYLRVLSERASYESMTFWLGCVMSVGVYFGLGFSGLGLGWLGKTVFSLLISATVISVARSVIRSRLVPRQIGNYLSKADRESVIPDEEFLRWLIAQVFREAGAVTPNAGAIAEESAALSAGLSYIPFTIVFFTLLKFVLSSWIWCSVLGLLLAIPCSVVVGKFAGWLGAHEAMYREVQDLIEAHPEISWQSFTEHWKEEEEEGQKAMIATQSAECPQCHSKQIVAETSSKGGSTTGAIIGGVLGGFVGAIIGDVVGGAVLGKTGTLFKCKSCGNKWDATKKQPVPSKTRVDPSSVAAGGCPSCGFSCKFDGATCGHCGFKAG